MGFLTYDDLYDIMLNGCDDLLIHGPAGYGKSHLINKLRREATNILFTAPTGIAAINIQGVTLHSLFCLKPVNPQPQEYDKPLPKNRIDLLKKCRTLLIDEISMVSCDLLDKIDIILRAARHNNDFFGGLRIIMIGDTFQLQPFVQGKKSLRLMRKLYPGHDTFKFYHSNIFKNFEFLSNLRVYNLTYDFRHENDSIFGYILSLIRTDEITEDSLKIINARAVNSPDDCIHLTTTKQIADFINSKEMENLSDKADISKLKLDILYSDEKINKNMYPLQDELSLKIGMKIIFVMNDSSFKGNRWVNGTKGKVIGKKYINNELESVEVLIDLKKGNKTYTVTREWYDIYIPTYNEEQNKISSLKIASVYQFPFIAAWAITIHRSQSLTIDSSAILELGAKVFSEGQLYVGLSRVRNMGNLFLNRIIKKEDIMVSTETKYIFEPFLKSQKRFVVRKNSPIQEYKENMSIYMPNSAANNFHERYVLSGKEINYIRQSNNFHEEKKNQNTQIYNKYSIPIKPLQEKIIAEPSLNNKIYKTKRAPEGLDKIKIILNPYYINLENKSDKLCSHNELTLHKGGPFRMVSIHAEFINHKQDIHISLARAVYHLIEKGIYTIEFLVGVDKYKAIYFISKHLNYFIILISEAEFYFNIRRENIVIKKEAIIYGYLRKIQDKERRGTSYYSKDYNEKYGRNSSAIIYDRYEKLIKDNQISHKILNKMKHKTRIELKLFNVSTDWIHIDNFKGTYRKIFNRYFYFLTILYKKFIKDYILINSSENRYLDKIVKGASIIDKIRFTNQDNKLSQQDTIDKNKMSLTKITNNEKEMAIAQLKILFDGFLETVDTTNEYIEFRKLLLNKNNERYLNIK